MGNITRKTVITVFSSIIVFSLLTACSLSASVKVVDIAAVPGVTPPVRGAVPVAEVAETEQYMGIIDWTPETSSFEGGTAYTAAITLIPKTGYTLTGVPADFFTVEGAASVANAEDSGVITAVFPATAPQVVVDIAAVSGVTPPVRGAVPASEITETEQYTGTVSWSPADDTFAGDTVYTATITLEPKPGYTFTGVPADFFTVAGADSVSSKAGSGVITAVFPATAMGIGDTITDGVVNYMVLTISGDAGTAEVIAGSYSGEIIVPETVDNAGVTYTVVSVGEGAFSDCRGLTSLSLPDSVTSVGDYAFNSCSGLTSVVLPDSVASLGEGAFQGCVGLTSARLPAGITSVGNSAFYGCINLIGITIPDGVVSIGDRAFYSCTSLKSVGFPEGLASIGEGAFQGCTSLTSISISSSDIYIGDYAFQGCTSLTSVNITGNVYFGKGAFQ